MQLYLKMDTKYFHNLVVAETTDLSQFQINKDDFDRVVQLVQAQFERSSPSAAFGKEVSIDFNGSRAIFYIRRAKDAMPENTFRTHYFKLMKTHVMSTDAIWIR